MSLVRSKGVTSIGLAEESVWFSPIKHVKIVSNTVSVLTEMITWLSPFILVQRGTALIDVCTSNQPCLLGMNPAWSRCGTSTRCQIWFA